MADKFRVRIVTPQGDFYGGEAAMLEFNTSVGEVGIYPQHMPMTYVLAPGILRIHEGSASEEPLEAALMQGFVQILPEEVTIIAATCEWPDEIDENRAREAKERAERLIRSHSPEIDLLRAEMALKRALVRLDVKSRH